ncbi:MAG: bifunctional diaminohydroxyphosphoribosylaminopyrimidine deaminase/5-amino-6-(5-phosphoribosylamino)uracil reductase RibD [Planctomycetaceae bacterium]|jgi:diaminohydroxyphosphoribosylaminopyrimidine deaminase/5-amino-6-(5-phosphoribosylamino)uracil reductase|nr:bifunctional diaminohydroxyphosphoribosylaminopyrimidine deaminase/5-amino-6-(5-phosphoribosylamino)uracil reductase RibD [Planctomycetaceae bacterium]
MTLTDDEYWMARAIGLARRGEGLVEPNPMVGCLLVAPREKTPERSALEVIGEGWHRAFGQPHAEIEAIRAAQNAGKSTVGATAYVTLEPCCHYGKTPPCTSALLQAGIRRVAVAMRDPFAQVNGGGIAQLRENGVEVSVGLLEPEARELNAPYLTRLEQRRPFVIAKWAMTLDGKIATHAGASQWISSEQSREIVHRLRAKSDAIFIGANTANTDNPHLTVRLPNISHASLSEKFTEKEQILQPHRTPIRVIFDSAASLSPTSYLATTARDVPVVVAASREILQSQNSAKQNAETLESRGCEVLQISGKNHRERITELLKILAERNVTNLLVEGGGTLLGLLFDNRFIDEVHVFIAPKLIGGQNAVSPVGGAGLENMAFASQIVNPAIEKIHGDIYCHGRIKR